MWATEFPRGRILSRLPDRGRFALEIAVAVLLLLGIVACRSVTTSDFIYFQF